jgi:hypothetical protein
MKSTKVFAALIAVLGIQPLLSLERRKSAEQPGISGAALLRYGLGQGHLAGNPNPLSWVISPEPGHFFVTSGRPRIF